MSIVTTSTLSAPVQQSFNARLLAIPVANLIYNIAAMKLQMPRNGGNTLRSRRYNLLNPAIVPLGNSGVTPPGQNLSALDIDGLIQWYGTYVIINEQVTLTLQDPVLNEAVKVLGISLRYTEDQLTRDKLASTASFINCTGGLNGDSPTNITESDIDVVVQALLGNNAHTIADNIEGRDAFGTAPIRSAYFGMMHTDMVSSLQAVNGFVQVNQYPSPMNALESEWGAVNSVRFLISSLGSISSNASMLGNNVYNILITGLQAYAYIEQDGMSATFIYRPPMYSDPLAQNCSAGYKLAACPIITNDLWVINQRATTL